MVANAIGAIAALGASALSNMSAESSSANQYKYQSKLNKQNYGYNVKLINLQNAFNEAMMDKANNWNLARWNESVDLANTSHQREVADLRKAGLNPVLSANGGAAVVNPIQSAQTSSGNSQLSSQAGMPEIDYLSAVETALNMRNAYKTTESDLKTAHVNRNYTHALTDKVGSEVQKIHNDIDISNKQTAMQQAMNDAQIRKIENDIYNNNRVTDSQLLSSLVDNAYKREMTAHSALDRKGKLEASRSEAEWIKNNPGLYKFGQTIQRIAPGLVGAGLVGSAGASIYKSATSKPPKPRVRGRR